MMQYKFNNTKVQFTKQLKAKPNFTFIFHVISILIFHTWPTIYFTHKGFVYGLTIQIL